MSNDDTGTGEGQDPFDPFGISFDDNFFSDSIDFLNPNNPNSNEEGFLASPQSNFEQLRPDPTRANPLNLNNHIQAPHNIPTPPGSGPGNSQISMHGNFSNINLYSSDQFAASNELRMYTRDDENRFPPVQASCHRRSRTQPMGNILPEHFNVNFPLQQISRRIQKPNRPSDCFSVGQNNRGIYLPNGTSEDEEFSKLCNDEQHLINPHQLGFIPSEYWPDEKYKFGNVVRDFFQRKNHPSCRFSHKLFNALQLTKANHNYFKFTGVEWKTDKVLHVNKNRFARLLGIKSIDGSLFHQQGNFPAFGFVELTAQEIKDTLGNDEVNEVNLEVDRYMIHTPNKFVCNCSEKDIAEDMKWKGVRQRYPM